MTPGQVLRHRRERLKLSQDDLAILLQVSQQLISAWEGDRRAIPAHRYPDLNRVLRAVPRPLRTCYEA